ncbi:MAG: chemotaxis protein CheX [Negativicutes bacterium]
MVNQNFGHFLLNKGLLTHVQLCEILKNEQSVKVKMGILAVNAGLMTAKQIEDVHNLQRVKDQKFGVLAVSQGYLTYEQVEALLASQKRGHLSLMQSIADKGYMTLAAVEGALVEFREKYNITGEDIEDENKVIKKMVDFSTAGENADLLYAYVGLTLRNIVRFLSDTPYILTPDIEQSHNYLALQQIYGEVKFLTGLSMDETVLLEFSRRFSGERLKVVDEMALDSVGEFLNVHNGVFCSSLSDVGIRADLKPQIVQQSDTRHEGKIYRIDIGTSFGQFKLILSL